MPRRATHFSSIGTLLTSINNAGFAQIKRQAQVLKKLEERVLHYLPTPLNLHCRIGTIDNNRLILFADSAAWATRLRFMVPELRKQLGRDNYMTVNEIEVRILPQNSPLLAAESPRQPPRMSESNAQLIASLARSVNDKALSQALEKLARARRGDDGSR